MGAKSGILNELYRWLAEQPTRHGSSMERIMSRAERVARDDPRLLEPFDNRALVDVLDQPHPVVSLRPGDFEGRLAFQFPEKYTDGLSGYTDEERTQAFRWLDEHIDELAQVVTRGGGLNEVPYLGVAADYIPAEEAADEAVGLFVRGHEGRHRSRALERLGYPAMLTKLYPKLSPIQPPAGTSRDAWLEQFIDTKPPVFGEEEGYWAGGPEFPFLSRYQRGGSV